MLPPASDLASRWAEKTKLSSGNIGQAVLELVAILALRAL